MACRSARLPAHAPGRHDHHAADAEAVAAFRQVLPEMPEKEAVHEVILAIAYASREHTAWFWKSVGGRGV
jgi:hypothetical protein